MPLSYLETLEFDLAVVLCVTVAMPLAVWGLRSGRALTKLTSCLALGIAVLYIGGFEHYRMTHHRAVDAQFHKSIDPEYRVVTESTWRVVYVQLSNVSRAAAQILERIEAADAVAAAAAGKAAGGEPAGGSNLASRRPDDATAIAGSTGPRAALLPARSVEQDIATSLPWLGSGLSAPREVLVSLAFPNSGGVLMKRILLNFMRVSCTLPEDAAAAAGPGASAAAAPQERTASDAVDDVVVSSWSTASAGQPRRVKCLTLAALGNWSAAALAAGGPQSDPHWLSPAPVIKSAASGRALTPDLVHAAVERGEWANVPRGLRMLGRRYYALFIVRDPRDLVVASYFLHAFSGAGEPWAAVPRETFDGKGITTELNSMSKEEGINREIDILSGVMDTAGEFADVRGRRSPGAAELLSAVRELASADDPALGFARYEDLLVGSRTALAAVGEFYGLTGTLLERFVREAAVAVEEYKSSAAPAVKAGPGLTPRSQLLDCGRAGSEAAQAVWCAEPPEEDPTLIMPGMWRQHFGPSNVAHFKNVHPGLLARLGYEASDDWGL